MNLEPEALLSLGLHSPGLVAATAGSAGAMLHARAEAAFSRLRQAAADAGFDLRVASAFRSFERQRQIWNGKLRGERAVLDDRDRPIDLACLDPQQRLECVLRFSAMPGASRHHWGSDIDVFDAAAVTDDYRVRLDLAEVADDGVFGPLHCWLDERIERGESFGFFRPYDRDRGGVAPERWHLSFAPLALIREEALRPEALIGAWRFGQAYGAGGVVEEAERLCEQAEALYERFVRRVAPAPRAALAYGGA